jgi:acetyl-CoA acetyltransferase
MKMNAYIIGVGMTHFGKHLELGLKALGGAAASEAIGDAGLETGDIEAAFVGNAAAGLITGQECIRGQVVLRSIGLGRIPVINVENACASASTALHQAAAMVTGGLYDVVLALGVEKLYSEDKQRTFAAFGGAVDVEFLAETMARLQQSGGTQGAGEKRSMFMDIYAQAARAHMRAYGTTVEQFAGVSAKNSSHGALNPRAQFREALTVEEVLAAPMVAAPLTRPMCSPIGDGAAAVVIASERRVRELGVSGRAVRIASCALHSGWDRAADEPGVSDYCAHEAYRDAGIGPDDIDVIELHDASAPAEILAYESLGLCPRGEGGRLIDEGATKLGGRLPVNTSGGLLRKGHPIGATGIAQVVEVAEQLMGRSGPRQVEGARVALTHNGGGSIGNDAAAQCVTVLTR